jgi:tetratricopeptide (TPR) repeat protein
VTRLLGRVALVLCVLCAWATSARAKAGDHKAEAKAHYDNAVRQFDLGKYDDAAEEFKTAYDLTGEAAILYNVAQAYRLAGNFDLAAQFYRNVLRKLPEVQNRDEIKGRIVEMDERAAEQKRQVERRETERRAAERKAHEARENTPPPVGNTPQGPEPAPRDSGVTAPAPQPGRPLEIAGYALCGVAGAGIIVGAVMSALTVQENNKVQSAAKQGGQTFSTSLRDAQDKGQLYGKLQYVGYGIGGAAAVGAVVTLVLGFRADRQARETSASRARFWADLSWSPSVGLGGGGLVLGGRF